MVFVNANLVLCADWKTGTELAALWVQFLDPVNYLTFGLQAETPR